MNLSTNATHYFPQTFSPGRLVLLDISGDFGGGTVTPGYKGGDDAFTPFIKEDVTPIALTARGGFEVRVPRSGQIGITLADSVEAAITLDVIIAVDMPPGS